MEMLQLLKSLRKNNVNNVGNVKVKATNKALKFSFLLELLLKENLKTDFRHKENVLYIPMNSSFVTNVRKNIFRLTIKMWRVYSFTLIKFSFDALDIWMNEKSENFYKHSQTISHPFLLI